MAVTNSPNMGLPIAGVGTEAGPNYAFDANISFTLLDQHDHSPGKGVQITPAGLNINSALSLQGNDLTNANSIVFSGQSSPDSTLLSLYVAPGTESPTPINDLWFTDGVGNQIQITSNGAVNATIASLPGESFAFGTFFWKQGTGSTTPANFDIGSITIRPNVAATTFGITLSPPSGISSQYSIALPLLPGAESFMTITAAGIINDSIPINQGINTSNIADGAITAAKLAAGVGTATSQTFSSSGSFTVPARVTTMWANITAGGGGGGGGGKGLSSGQGGAGGAGGQGSVPIPFIFSVAPSDVLTLTIGAGGTAGLGGTSPAGAPGTAGGNGGIASIIKNGTTTIALVTGGLGGAGGQGNDPSLNIGGVGATSVLNATSFGSLGGSGGNAGTGASVNGTAGGNSFTASGGAGGANNGVKGGGGGGGGGAGIGNGPAGGPGGSGSGSNAVNTSAGGGGGGGGSTGANGRNGGTGAPGTITLYWIP